MVDVVISVEQLSKRYRLGVVSHKTLTHDLQSWWARKRGKIDPNGKIIHSSASPSAEGDDEEDLWALRDISFEVKQGEIVGIIGRNGAGKSTLLKILSRVTAPTEGQVRVKGRIASLLEVGTGFHPELTGRENIFLNGSILGMTKAEVRRKFDEIVQFAEIEKFIDTPVKRYSSGMYVRLAFAVAAHLDPEILIVDEVLAVGDAEFQKKCLGKMGDVASTGRTVLFVSHNMGSIQALCSRGIVMHKGELKLNGDVASAISAYLSSGKLSTIKTWDSQSLKPGNSVFALHAIYVEQTGTPQHKGYFSSTSRLSITIIFELREIVKDLCIGFDMYNDKGELLFRSYHTDQEDKLWPDLSVGIQKLEGEFDLRMLNSGTYYIAPRVSVHNLYWIVNIDPAVSFDLIAEHAKSRIWNMTNARSKPGSIAPVLPWRLVQEW